MLDKKITIIGAGLAGALLAIYLAKRQYQVDIYESRSDLRHCGLDSGRSINLAMSCRGLTSLKAVGLDVPAKRWMVPMRGRAIHEENGEIHYQPFGRQQGEYINAIERSALNALLLDTLEQFPQVTLHFNAQLLTLDLHKKQLQFQFADGNRVNTPYEHLIGADGAGSFVRETLFKENLVSASRNFLAHGYKELSITRPRTSPFTKEYLHLWPRNSFLLLGNPNPDESITGSLFMAKEGKTSFAELDDEIKIKHFFKSVFPDAYDAMPRLIEEFFQHPLGNMSTINCSPWYYKDQCLLIGDAAHGVVPFFGQGMNCAFEDCRILNQLLDQYQDSWDRVLPAFFALRKINTDAVAEMSMENFREIQIDIRDPSFLFKKELELELMRRYPTYLSKHVLVMFTNTSYSEALHIGQLQKKLLSTISKLTKNIKSIPWYEVDKIMKNYDKNLAETKGY